MRLKLKICGMKYPKNIEEVAALQPDYLGFIFYKKSQRNFDGLIPEISKDIRKTGVFVNASVEFIRKKVKKYNLQAIQLHGDESPKCCNELKLNKKLEVIKVFSVGENFDFETIKKYEKVCDYYLFDTKGKEKGGNGITFNWNQMEKYDSEKPYFLSGGIGLEEANEIKQFFKTKASEKCFAIDVNSKFEDEPGLKNIKKLNNFIKQLNSR